MMNCPPRLPLPSIEPAIGTLVQAQRAAQTYAERIRALDIPPDTALARSSPTGAPVGSPCCVRLEAGEAFVKFLE
jgi:hypothetical protein